MNYAEVVADLNAAKAKLTELDAKCNVRIPMRVGFSGHLVAEIELCEVEWPSTGPGNADVVLSLYRTEDAEDPEAPREAVRAEEMSGSDLLDFAYLRMRFEEWKAGRGEFPGHKRLFTDGHLHRGKVLEGIKEMGEAALGIKE